MKILAVLPGLTLCAVLLADDHNVDFDSHTDFSVIKTFALHEAKVNSPRPELNNPLVARKIGDAIRSELIAKGLKETSNPDVLVDYGITGEEYAEQRGGAPSFNRGILVIDLVKRDSKTLVWRAVYRDDERTAGKLAQKLPADVKKSLSEYPPRQKKRVIELLPPPVAVRDATPKGVAASALAIIQSTRE